ncbi:hypothetical protein AX14_000348 [Amanita brunnescens Koide BX004]|nr:hypothetical protein AX14_000348 [Amanita brunnescens Koide BX004]
MVTTTRSNTRSRHTRSHANSQPSRACTAPLPDLLRRKGTPTSSLTLSKEDGSDQDHFTAGDCIFIVHEALDLSNRPIDPHNYWKGQIDSFYSYKSHLWVIIKWFYTSSQLLDVGVQQEVCERLGAAELVLSNHTDTISSSCIESKCEIKFLDDTNPVEKWIHPSTWFYRLEIEFHDKLLPVLKVGFVHNIH